MHFLAGRVKQNKSLLLILGALFVITFAIIAFNGYEASAQNRTLHWGSRGNEVSTVQQKLRQWGYYHGFTDGLYGSATYNAVREFQRKNGLRADGVVGKSTWAALGYSAAAAQKPSAPAAANTDVSRGVVRTSQDVMLLARVIEGEAADEPTSGKVAVGAVILNRIRSSAFPNTLAGVVYQPLAFESVANGQVNRPLTNDSISAARQAMAGWDPTGGATFFWNPSKRVSSWIWSRQIIARIGRHVFAR
ncbi:MAG: spore cortex-lytic protein [Desulfotomaculum sp. BICA1-6]|nr:MAG: spore cortex-lytic protein [Desulfotomaculum sp. BICA1-6]